MKAITIRQPWATLIALGVKTIETRSWRAPKALIGQTIAIHAGAFKPVPGEEYGTGWWWDWDVDEGIIVRQSGDWESHPAPLGAIVATATLADCVPMIAEDNFTIDRQDGHDDWLIIARPFRGPASLTPPRLVRFIDPGSGDAGVVLDDQLPYGDFRPGRWAWMLADIKPTTERCPACDGTGQGDESQAWSFHGCIEPGSVPPCGYCQGDGGGPPIPAKGKQGVWEWTP